MHRIDGESRLESYMASTRLNAEWSFFQELRDVGRDCAKAWLEKHFAAIGHRGTLDLKKAYA